MIRPIGDRVVLRRAKSEEKSPGGIILPSNAQEKSLEAIVIAVGPGKLVGTTFVEPIVKKNDRVLVGKYTGLELTFEGVEYLIVREEDIIGILDK